MKLKIKSFKDWVSFKYRSFIRDYYLNKIRCHLPTSTTIVCNNCFGARIYQDLDMPYNSPTAGLFIRFPEYIVFLKHLKEFCSQPLSFKVYKGGRIFNAEGGNYPIGILSYNGEEVEVHFLHYKNQEEAKEKWERRCKRMDFDNLLIIGSETDGCQKDDIEKFANLSYHNKIFFTRNRYDLNCTYYLKAFNNKHFTNLYAFAHLGYRGIWNNLFKHTNR